MEHGKSVNLKLKPLPYKRSPLAPLKKGGTGNFLKVPLFKGDLGGYKLKTVVIKVNSNNNREQKRNQ
jgi:hypothetical protein